MKLAKSLKNIGRQEVVEAIISKKLLEHGAVDKDILIANLMKAWGMSKRTAEEIINSVILRKDYAEIERVIIEKRCMKTK